MVVAVLARKHHGHDYQHAEVYKPHCFDVLQHEPPSICPKNLVRMVQKISQV